MVRDFVDVFSDEITRLPPEREVDFAIDYRMINHVTIKSIYPFPCIDGLFD